MSDDPGVVARLRAWFELSPPESFTYRSYLRYVARSLPRYGIGPALLIAYQLVARGPATAVFFVGTLLAALLASLSGFALARRDSLYCGLALASTLAVYAAIYRWLTAGLAVLPLPALDLWPLVFAGWLGALSLLAGAAAARR